MRSHSETVKHRATKGIIPTRIAVNEGRFIGRSVFQEICERFIYTRIAAELVAASVIELDQLCMRRVSEFNCWHKCK